MESGHGTHIDGIDCFAPKLAQSCADYPKEAFAKLAEIEDPFLVQLAQCTDSSFGDIYDATDLPFRECFDAIGAFDNQVLQAVMRLDEFLIRRVGTCRLAPHY